MMNTVTPLVSAPQGAYLFQTHLRGSSLIEMGAYFRGGGVFKFSKHDGINFSQRPRIQIKWKILIRVGGHA